MDTEYQKDLLAVALHGLLSNPNWMRTPRTPAQTAEWANAYAQAATKYAPEPPPPPEPPTGETAIVPPDHD